MRKEEVPEFDSEFEKDVFHGLTSTPKFLNSKYFYDKVGDKLFQEIMELPEYYLTDCEFEILDTHKEEIAKDFDTNEGFNILDLGAGDGFKTKILLKHFLQEDLDFSYHPIDISENALQQLSLSLNSELPNLKIFPKQGTYTETIKSIGSIGDRRNAILFLGSNIGNMSSSTAIGFLKTLFSSMKKEDLLFIGFDMKKDPSVVLEAYNDLKGVTAAFNKNLLTRINKELQADFDTNSFLHWPLYDPQSGEVQSFLISDKKQLVSLKKINLSLTFYKWEAIQTEISRKFDTSSIEVLARESGFKIVKYLTDKKGYFRNYIFKKNNSGKGF